MVVNREFLIFTILLGWSYFIYCLFDWVESNDLGNRHIRFRNEQIPEACDVYISLRVTLRGWCLFDSLI